MAEISGLFQPLLDGVGVAIQLCPCPGLGQSPQVPRSVAEARVASCEVCQEIGKAQARSLRGTKGVLEDGEGRTLLL